MLTEGGAERVASMWINGFVEKGHDVHVIMKTNHPQPITYQIPKEVKIYNIALKKLPLLLKKVIEKFITYQPYRLRKIIKEIKPDLIIGLLHPYASWARIASKGMNIPIINTEHNSFERPESVPFTTKELNNKFIENKYFNHVTVLTQADKDVIGNRLKNVSVLPNPLCLEPAKNISSKKNIILASGRLYAWHVKGLDILIKAWAKIAYKYPEWKLEIAGNDRNNHQAFLERIAIKEKLNSSQLSFLGFCKDVESLYKRSSIFVMSSRYEGFGMVLIEAMSQGCACIACDYKGRQREIIQNDTQGIICPVEDIDALSSAIERMITDKNYRQECQRNAIERSKYYNLDKTMDRWENILSNL